MTEIKMVWAEDEQHGIGKNGQVPWDLPADRALFKKETLHSTMIMGRKTWDSIGRPLPQRQSVVVTQQPDFSTNCKDVVVCHDLADVLKYIQSISGLVTVIGGAQIYKMMMPYATQLVVTRVTGDFAGDTWVEPVDLDVFDLTKSQSEEQNGIEFKIMYYQRKGK
ncbi:dihydrofolate reductase [Convivina intestini]|uniref:Dihydrofolate reductase n=1 Tax=Convivina intestini TaxID=1505726 RepID=A0A2U1DET8_9LACO|nr:dihydrofolate reductase [Convivina intestini]PVY86195.1 dihydrofolate reductase [Convivina intestini]CAH1851376.1 Dihydrofolate reductase [Convivina intestini]CAH1852815.1 Dihydrofolate reductase [Convivina intestini]SDB81403.1 dihydrofolate reductase [Leuconostocaceae bacterium R-53105]